MVKKLLILLAALWLLPGCGEGPSAVSSTAAPSAAVSEQAASGSREEEVFPLAEVLSLPAAEVTAFRYERLSAQEEQRLDLSGKDAVQAAQALLGFDVSRIAAGQGEPVVGGAARYTLTFADGTELVVYDDGRLSVNGGEPLCQREGEEEIPLPEDACWQVFTVDLFTGDKTPARAG